MRRSTKIAMAFAILVLVTGGYLVADGPKKPSDAGDDLAQQRKVLGQAMTKKLKHAQELLVALSVEDFDRLADNAKILKFICEDTLWKVSPNLKYVKYSGDFAAIADELVRRANERDLNGATLSYVRMTINCIECHKFVRDNRILQPER